MHVVFITNEFPTPGLPHGGVGTFAKSIASNLVKRSIRVTVIGIYRVPSLSVLEEEGISIHRIPLSKWPFGKFIDQSLRINRRLQAVHRETPVDIVESAELSLAFINKIKGIKYVIRMHGGHHFFSQSEKRGVNRWKGYQEKRAFRKADSLVGVSRYVVNHTAEYMKFDPGHVPVIFNAPNVNSFRKADINKTVKGRIVFVGTVCEKKGIRQLVMAMPAICREIPSAHLMIAGRDWLFPSGLSYMQYLKGFIDPSVKDRIIFLGSLPNSEVPGLIESAEVCVYPSHMEAMPLAWLEGLAMGKAVVASKTGPGPEVIRDGITGLLCDPYSAEDISRKVIEVLKNSTLALSLSEAAYQDIRNRFDVGKIVNDNIEFYRKIQS